MERELLADYVPTDSATVEDATCPDEVSRGEGERFRCTLVIDGQELEVIVRQEDDEGTVSFQPGQLVLDRADVEADVATQTGRELGQLVTARCGDTPSGLLVVPPGDRFSCAVTDENGSELTVVATLDDEGVIVVEPGS